MRSGLKVLGKLADIEVKSRLGTLTDSKSDAKAVNDYFIENIASPLVNSSGLIIDLVGDCFPYAGFNSAKMRGSIHVGDYLLIEKYAGEIEAVMREEDSNWVMTPARKKNIEARLKEYFMLHELYELDGLVLTYLKAQLNDKQKGTVPEGMVALYESHLNASEQDGGFNEYPPIINSLKRIAEETGLGVVVLLDLIHAQGVVGVPEISIKYAAHVLCGQALDEAIGKIDINESTKSVTTQMTKKLVYIDEGIYSPLSVEKVTGIKKRFNKMLVAEGETNLRSNRVLFKPSEVFYLIKAVATLQDKNDVRYKEALSTLREIIYVVDGGSLEGDSLVREVLELFEAHYPGSE
jgi:hypothetical protein